MKASKKRIQTKQGEVSYTHIETGSNKVCFMLSGAGYTYDKPLFYYATMAMLENKFDVVQVHYSYDGTLFEKPFAEIVDIIMGDVDPVLGDVLSSGEYTETVLLGKSLGSIPVAGELMKREQFSQSKMILLTPLLKFNALYETLLHSGHTGLLVIGDRDPHYLPDMIEELRNTTFEIQVIPDANHSLDVGKFETGNSILVLSQVMESIRAVL